MIQSCIDVPVSWLRLERYHLGELDAAERSEIERHVARCEVCADCLALAGEKREILPLVPPAKKRPARTWPIASVIGSLALAAAAVLFIHPWSRPEALHEFVSPESRVKGGDISFALVRDDEEWFPDATGNYRDGDRFRVAVTCPAALDVSFDVVVFEHGEASFPLESTRVNCGNTVPMAGAFRLTGREPMTVCLVWDDVAVNRQRIASGGESALDDHSVCKSLSSR